MSTVVAQSMLADSGCLAASPAVDFSIRMVYASVKTLLRIQTLAGRAVAIQESTASIACMPMVSLSLCFPRGLP